MGERPETRIAAGGGRAAIDLGRLARNVAAGERRIVAQHNLIERLRIGGKQTDEAEIILQEMQDLLRTMRSLLADIRKFVEAGAFSDGGAAAPERKDEGRTDQAQKP